MRRKETTLMDKIDTFPFKRKKSRDWEQFKVMWVCPHDLKNMRWKATENTPAHREEIVRAKQGGTSSGLNSGSASFEVCVLRLLKVLLKDPAF